MSVSTILVLSSLSFINLHEIIPGQRNQGSLEIKILQVPAFQSRILSIEKQEGGGVVGGVLGGYVTANFPEGYIVLKTTSDANLSEIQKLIKEKMALFPCNCGDYVQISMISTQIIESSR